MALEVLSVAYPLAPVLEDSVGGAEQVLAALDRALVAEGHGSTVVCAAGSEVAGRLVPVPVPGGTLSSAVADHLAHEYRRVLEHLLRERRYDLVHFHGCDCGAYLPMLAIPPRVARLVTLHVPVEWYAGKLFDPKLRLSFASVSEHQRRHLPPRLAVSATIGNGVDLARWQPLPEAPDEYALCLGRICPEKGFDQALRAAHAADMELLIAGQTFAYPEHLRYFEEQIAPLLDARRRFIGPVAGALKRTLLARARCVVVPSRVAETSSLVTMEALACGTPVVVSDRGAPASLIEAGVTGLVASDELALAAAFSRVGELDRRACRTSAERRFDLRQTTRNYLELYERLAREARSEASSAGAGA
jgi:glycosyltransferase involved in cell wall biosynthesis